MLSQNFIRTSAHFQPTLWNAPSRGWTFGFVELKPNSIYYLNNESYSNYPHFRIIPNIPTLHIVMMFMHSHAWTSSGSRQRNTIVQVSHFLDCLQLKYPMLLSRKWRSYPNGIMTIRISHFSISYLPNPSSGVPWSLVSMLILVTS